MDYSVVKKPAVYWSLIGVAVVVIVVLVVALSGSSGPGKSSGTTTTTAPVRTHTTQQQAVIASLSVARAALYENTNAKAPVTAKDVVLAAAPDRGTLIVIKNLGEIASSPQMVAFQWNFGGAPILTCVNVPTDRSGTATEATCPKGISTVSVTTTTTKSRHGVTTSTPALPTTTVKHKKK
jgi:hypothetical protein